MSDIDLSQVQWDPSPLIGIPAGMKYTPAQMAQLNAARDSLRADEATGMYGPGGTGAPQVATIDPSKVQWDQAPQGPSVSDVQRAMLARQMAGGQLIGPDVAFGARQVYDAAKQAIGHLMGNGASADADAQAALGAYNKTYQPDVFPGSSIARGAGQMLATAPLAAIGGTGGAIRAAMQGAATGGAANALTPVYGDTADFGAQKLGQLKTGAELGAATGGIGNLAGRVLAPNSRDAVQALTGEGISPTIGQTLGGFWKTLEDKLTSVPLVGDAIKSGQSRALDQFNNAIYNRILAPIGERYNGTAGQQALGTVRDKLSNAYESTLAKMGPTPLTDSFNSGIDNIRGMLASRPAALQTFDAALNNDLWPRFTPASTLTPSELKNADSALGSAARNYFNRGDADQFTAAQALSEVQRGLRQMAADANPQQAPILRAVDNGYAQLVQLQNAAKSVKVARNEGVVTPADYLRGIKSGDVSARDNVFSSGQALNQDFAQAADKVLSSKYPDSGSVGRGLAAAALGGAFAPKALALGAAGAIPYLPFVQGGLSALLSRRPELLGLLGTGVKQAAPYLGAAAPAGLLTYQ